MVSDWMIHADLLLRSCRICSWCHKITAVGVAFLVGYFSYTVIQQYLVKLVSATCLRVRLKTRHLELGGVYLSKLSFWISLDLLGGRILSPVIIYDWEKIKLEPPKSETHIGLKGGQKFPG